MIQIFFLNILQWYQWLTKKGSKIFIQPNRYKKKSQTQKDQAVSEGVPIASGGGMIYVYQDQFNNNYNSQGSIN